MFIQQCKAYDVSVSHYWYYKTANGSQEVDWRKKRYCSAMVRIFLLWDPSPRLLYGVAMKLDTSTAF